MGPAGPGRSRGRTIPKQKSALDRYYTLPSGQSHFSLGFQMSFAMV
jgi:hypothetical protein